MFDADRKLNFFLNDIGELFTKNSERGDVIMRQIVWEEIFNYF